MQSELSINNISYNTKLYSDLEFKNKELNSINNKLKTEIENLKILNQKLELKYNAAFNNYEKSYINIKNLEKINTQLELSNKGYSKLLTDLNSHLLILDDKLNIVRYSDGFLKFVDLEKITDINLSSFILNIDLNLPNILEDIKKVLNSSEIIMKDLDYKNRNYRLSISELNVQIEENNSRFILLSFIDKTDIVKNEKMLFQKSKHASLGEMIGNIAHQWRQPLNRLSTILMKLQFDYENGSLDKDNMQELQNKTDLIIQNMSKTIDDFKSFFSPNKLKRYFNIKTSIEDSLLLVNDNGVNKIIIETDLEDEIYINSYENEFIQVFLNLINNAKDAININEVEYGFIYVSLCLKDEKIVISVKDNGGGISEKIMDKIFEPYFTTKFKFNGTGLGLYMCKLIVEDSLNGNLEILNTQNGVEAKITLNKVE